MRVRAWVIQIGNLKHLRMLALDGNKLSSIPESISGLQDLQVCMNCPVSHLNIKKPCHTGH